MRALSSCCAFGIKAREPIHLFNVSVTRDRPFCVSVTSYVADLPCEFDLRRGPAVAA